MRSLAQNLTLALMRALCPISWPRSARKSEDAGLPDTNRRDPHTSGESLALQRPQRDTILWQAQDRLFRLLPGVFDIVPLQDQRAGRSARYDGERAKMPGFPTRTVGTPTHRGKARRYRPKRDRGKVKRREISHYAGRPLCRSKADRKSRPASFEMTVVVDGVNVRFLTGRWRGRWRKLRRTPVRVW